MNQSEIERKVRSSMESGTLHHFYDSEIRTYSLLSVEPDRLKNILTPEVFAPSLEMYSDLLGPTRVRSIKNGLICYITIVSRVAIKAGVDPEFSYALSDYYINYLETLVREEELMKLLIDITLHYNDLIYRNDHVGHGKAIDAAVRYMQQRLYTHSSIQDIAAFTGLEPHYFSSLFKSEMGMSPLNYYMEMKMKEARRLLRLPGYTVTRVAAALGFADGSHFSRRFKQYTGISPREYQDSVELFDEADRYKQGKKEE